MGRSRARPPPEEARLLTDVFHFHELAIEDALAEIHHPKVESYGDYLYLILHGIDFKAREHAFRTQEVDFFLGAQYLVTFHNGTSRSIGRIGEICIRNERVLGEGPAVLLYRIVDTMVDNYRPEVDKLGDRLDTLEKEVFARPKSTLVKRILDFKRDVSSLRRVIMPERDAVGAPRAAASSRRSPKACRISSATCTITSCGCPTRRSTSRIASRACSTRTCRTSRTS